VVPRTTVDRLLKGKVCVANGKEIMRSGLENCLRCLPLTLLKPNQFIDNINIFYLVPHKTIVSICFFVTMLRYLKFCILFMHTSFIHLSICFKTGPKPLPKRAVHIVRTIACSFLLSLRSSSSFLYFLPRLPVTSISCFIFLSITFCRRHFLRKMRPIQLASSVYLFHVGSSAP
jgi:hypothetical protein